MNIVTRGPKIQFSRYQFSGCIVGGAVGDALGMPVELTPRAARIKMGYISRYIDHPTGKLEAGQWTDDTLLTAVTLKSLVNYNAVDLDNLRYEMREVMVLEKQAGFGNTTYRALQGMRPAARSSGNGAAMRIAPVALFSAANLETLKANCEAVSRITHNNKEAVDAAVAVGFIIAKIVRNEMKLATIISETMSFIGESEMAYKLGEVQDLLKNESLTIEQGLDHIGTRGLAMESVASATSSGRRWTLV